MKTFITQCEMVIEKKKAANTYNFQQVNTYLLQHSISFLVGEVIIQVLPRLTCFLPPGKKQLY